MIAELEPEFRKTCKILLGTELEGLNEYSPWIGKYVSLPYPLKSALSGKEVWVSPSLNYLNKSFEPSRMISMEEAEKTNSSPFKPEDLDDAGYKEIFEKIIKPVAYYCGNYRYQSHVNIEKCSGAGGGVNIYYSDDAYHGVKNIAYCNYVLGSSNMFGCHGVPQSGFCIHAYNSANISRCFEVDGCTNSSDLLFCHNCEGMSDSMFCFNAKNLHYAIGNVEVGRENYLRIKKILLNHIIEKLRADKELDIDIYNIGKYRGRKLWHKKLTMH